MKGPSACGKRCEGWAEAVARRDWFQKIGVRAYHPDSHSERWYKQENQFSINGMYLQVNIAERTLHGRQQIPNRPGRSGSISELDLIIERAVSTGWHVKESPRSGDGFA